MRVDAPDVLDNDDLHSFDLLIIDGPNEGQTTKLGGLEVPVGTFTMPTECDLPYVNSP